jgi:putative transposase
LLFQEETCLLELTRYIHLNPLRAGIVKDLGGLDTDLFAGHSVIMGNQPAEWQDDDRILGMFAKTRKAARRKYRQFVEKGIDAGRRPEMEGGGLIRSVGGWKMVKTLLKGQDRVKSDERILADGEFVQSVLDRCHEAYSRRQRRVAQGVDLKMLSHGVADYFNLSDDRLFTPGRILPWCRPAAYSVFWR